MKQMVPPEARNHQHTEPTDINGMVVLVTQEQNASQLLRRPL